MRAKAEEAITADLGVYPIAPAADNRAAAARFAATHRLPVPAGQSPALAGLRPTPRLRMQLLAVGLAAVAADLVAAVADLAAAADMKAADGNNL